jgi:hypothetical protein
MSGPRPASAARGPDPGDPVNDGYAPCRPSASRGEGAEGAACVRPSMRTPARTVTFTRGLPGVLRVMRAASPEILTDMASEATKKIILGG